MNYKIDNFYMDISVCFRMAYSFIGIWFLQVTSCTASLVQAKVHGTMLLWHTLYVWLEIVSILEILQLKQKTMEDGRGKAKKKKENFLKIHLSCSNRLNSWQSFQRNVSMPRNKLCFLKVRQFSTSKQDHKARIM